MGNELNKLTSKSAIPSISNHFLFLLKFFRTNSASSKFTHQFSCFDSVKMAFIRIFNSCLRLYVTLTRTIVIGFFDVIRLNMKFFTTGLAVNIVGRTITFFGTIFSFIFYCGNNIEGVVTSFANKFNFFRRSFYPKMMQSAMFACLCKKAKIFNSIIIFNPVYMMNLFTGVENPSNVFFHDKAMFKDIPRFSNIGMRRVFEINIPFFGFIFSCPRLMEARLRAIKTFICIKCREINKKYFFAYFTNAFDVFRSTHIVYTITNKVVNFKYSYDA